MMAKTFEYPLTRQGIRDLDRMRPVTEHFSGTSESGAMATNAISGERLVAGCGGMALPMLGLQRSAALGLLIALAGASLVWRATIGHSASAETPKM